VAKKIGLIILVLSALAFSGCDLILDLIFGVDMTVELSASSTWVYSLEEIEFTAFVDGYDGSPGALRYTWYYDADAYESVYDTDYYSAYAGTSQIYCDVSVSVTDGSTTAESNVIRVYVNPYSGGGTISIHNDSSYQIVSLFAGAYDNWAWGFDTLGYDGVINAGAIKDLVALPPLIGDTYGYAFRIYGSSELYEFANAPITITGNEVVEVHIVDNDIIDYYANKSLSARSLTPDRARDR